MGLTSSPAPTPLPRSQYGTSLLPVSWGRGWPGPKHRQGSFQAPYSGDSHKNASKSRASLTCEDVGSEIILEDGADRVDALGSEMAHHLQEGLGKGGGHTVGLPCPPAPSSGRVTF